jgi:hypothetical protein
MPSLTGELTKEELEKARAWILSHLKEGFACPVSGTSAWELAPHYVQYVTGILTRAGNISYPMVMLTCKDCGFTMFFNAVKIGLLPEASSPAEAQARSAEPQEVPKNG